MKKKVFIITFLATITLLYVFLNFYINDSKKNIENNLSNPLDCDLNIQDCTYKFQDKEVFISLNPKPLQALDITNLQIKNLGNYTNLEIKIYGLNMYMGEIKPKLHQINTTDYESKIVLANCILDTMRFRAELIKNGKPIGFYFDFELKK